MPKVKVVRYVRPLQQFETCIAESNLGGITLLFEIDQEEETLKVSYAICDDTDNFNMDIANNVVNGRFDRLSSTLKFSYDRNLSLVDNLEFFLDYLFKEGTMFENGTITLYNKLKRYLKHNLKMQKIKNA